MGNRLALALLLALALSTEAFGAIRTEKVPYRHGDVELEGYLAYDDALSGPRPAVLVVHEWWGLTDYIRERTVQVAGLGYVAFAADMYGKGVVTDDPKKAGELSGRFRSDLPLGRARIREAFDLLAKNPRVDPKRIAVIGYCFGGTTALELARSGAPVAGVVSFHGGLGTTAPAGAGTIKGKVLALHGGDDPFVPPAQVAAFEDEMRNAKVDWQVDVYGGAVHAFTNPGVGRYNLKGAAYDEKADKRSWKAMVAFLNEVFG